MIIDQYLENKQKLWEKKAAQPGISSFRRSIAEFYYKLFNKQRENLHNECYKPLIAFIRNNYHECCNALNHAKCSMADKGHHGESQGIRDSRVAILESTLIELGMAVSELKEMLRAKGLEHEWNEYDPAYCPPDYKSFQPPVVLQL